MSTQSRKSARAAAQNPAETVESPSPRAASLSVRLWAIPSDSDSGPAQSLWENDSPAACLTLDLIAASGGLPTARHEEVLVASFPTFLSAAMTARRLQWAIQGYAEHEEPRTTSLALLIHSPEEDAAQTVAEDAFHSLAQAASGAILLTEKASQPFDRLPGFPLQVAAGDGLWELAWSSPEGHFSRSEDEEFLAQFAAEQGVPEQAPPPPVPQAAAEAAFAEEYRTGSHRTGSHRQPSEAEARGSSKIWIGAAALAVVVVVAAAIYYFSGKPSQSTATDQNAAQTAAQIQPQPGTTAENTPVAKENSSPAAPSKHSAAQERAEAKAAAKQAKNAVKPDVQPAQVAPPPERERPAPKPAEPPAQKPGKDSRCELDPGQYSGQIAQAEKNMGRGKYDAAIRQLSAVLACDPGNASARGDLERAKLASAE